jgi:hypothetical protein
MYRCPVLYGGSAPNSINDLGYTPRTFTNFSDYANEVGLSRVYGGIYVRSSDFVGLEWGNTVDADMSALKFKRNSQTKFYRFATCSTK